MANNPATVLQDPQVAAPISNVFWINFLTNRYLAVRGWNTLPSGYKASVLNRWIKDNGHIVLFKHKIDNIATKGYTERLMFAPATFGPENEFGQPSTATVTFNTPNSEPIELQYGEFVVFWDFCNNGIDANCYNQPVLTSILYYAELISQAQRSVDNIVFWRGIPKIFGADEKTKSEIEKVLNATDFRYKAVFSLKYFNEQAKPLTNQLDMAYSPDHDKALWDDIGEYIKAFDIAIGFMPDNDMNKSERVTATESLSGYAAVMQLNDSREASWEESYQEAVELFGADFDIPSCYILNKPVDYLKALSEAVQQNYNNTETEEDEDGSKENESEETGV